MRFLAACQRKRAVMTRGGDPESRGKLKLGYLGG